jgi:hypothetical protein
MLNHGENVTFHLSSKNATVHLTGYFLNDDPFGEDQGHDDYSSSKKSKKGKQKISFIETSKIKQC